jgi:hypothetical protein
MFLNRPPLETVFRHLLIFAKLDQKTFFDHLPTFAKHGKKNIFATLQFPTRPFA